MAILDQNLVFSSAQSLAISTNTASTNIIPVISAAPAAYGNGSGGRDIGIGDGEWIPKILAYVYGTPTSTDSATLNIALQGSTDSSTWTTMVETGPLAMSVLASSTNVPGVKVAAFDIPHRAPGEALPLYYRLLYQVPSGTAISTGTISAYIGIQREDWSAAQYPSNFSVM